MAEKKRQLRNGDRIKVWEDPMTRTRLEGMAFLVRCLDRSDPELGERWRVHFAGEDNNVERTVRPEDLIS